jgi:4-hydroxybenzoate polyprenyltransferase
MIRLTTFSGIVQPKFAVFAGSFVFAGALLPFATVDFEYQAHWTIWLWIALAFWCARTAGMAFNKLIDRKIDAKNPRTATRDLPQGRAGVGEVSIVAWGSLLLFMLACFQINRVVFLLSPLVSALLILYSYTKRFTSLCHVVLGLIEFFGPVMAWAAIAGSISLPAIFLGLAFWSSITASDIVYGMMDYRFDSGHGIYSLPVKMGPQWALRLARWIHVFTVCCLAMVGWMIDLHLLYFIGIAFVAGLLRYHHQVLRVSAMDAIPKAFFLCNGLVGVIVLLSVIADLVWRAL